MRIYSLNLAAWLISKGYKYEINESDEQKGKYYFIFKDDISQEKRNYQNNNELHNFLQVYKIIKKEINHKRSKNK